MRVSLGDDDVVVVVLLLSWKSCGRAKKFGSAKGGEATCIEAWHCTQSMCFEADTHWKWAHDDALLWRSV